MSHTSSTEARKKQCCQCTQQKPAAAFLASKATPDGLTDRCKCCVFANAARDRAERESRRSATGAATGGVNRRQRTNLTPSALERISTHV